LKLFLVLLPRLTQVNTGMDPKALTAKLTSARVLLVDDEPYTRKVVRTMLLGMGVSAVH
jgi:hypothetical protein